jgi:N-acyl-D-aspartate/D-glutamate deacylase
MLFVPRALLPRIRAVVIGRALALGLVVTIAATLAPLPGHAAPPDFDLLIRGGRVVDGTGNPGLLADVGIKQGKIAAVGVLRARTAARTFEASGLVVAPGFIDMHNHSDDALLVDGDAQSMVRQGVTSMILGEGGSAAPSDRFATFKAYFAKLLDKGVATNVGSYVGSSQLWERVVGPRQGPATADERARMQALVRQAMLDGALGVASSLSGPPGAWIDTDSLVAMCEAAAPFGGIYSTHMRTEGHGVFEAVDEALTIGRRAGLPVDLIHLIAEGSLWGKMPTLIDKIAAARAAGADVQAHVIRTAPVRTTCRRSSRPGRTRAAEPRCWRACAIPSSARRSSATSSTGSPAGTTTSRRSAGGRACSSLRCRPQRTSASRASA